MRRLHPQLHSVIHLINYLLAFVLFSLLCFVFVRLGWPSVVEVQLSVLFSSPLTLDEKDPQKESGLSSFCRA